MSTITQFGTTSPPMDDSQLASRARTDADAFAELYRRHLTRVYRYHLAHIGNARDAEDLTSQTFMAALESIGAYRGTGTFSAWLMGIAMRKRLMFFRGKHAELPVDDALNIPDAGLSTDQAALQHLQLDQILVALRNLNSERREAITLYFFAGLEASEAARVLGKSEAATRMLISRGLHDLRTRTSVALEVQDE